MMQRMLFYLSHTGVWVGGLAVAAFLVLYWVLRGAPVGQAASEDSDDDAPTSGYRDRVIATVIFGLLLVAAGAYVAVAGRVIWSLPVFGLGFGIVLTLLAFNRRHRHASPALRRTLEFSDAALNTALVAGVLVVINVLAFRYGGQPFDFTREKSFELSTLTKNQLATLDRPLTFTVVFGGGPYAAPQRNRVLELLELYKSASPSKVRIEYINPFTELDKVEALIKRVPNIPIPQDGGILIDFGEGDSAQHVMVRNADLFEAPRQNHPPEGPARFSTDFRGEDAITSALIGLREDRKPKVAFTTGHGEPSINKFEPGREGVGVWRARLDAIGSEVVEVGTLTGEIPSDIVLLVIAGPKTPFRPDEVARVKRYVDRGGPLLLLLGNLSPTGLDDLLRSFNVEFGKGVLVDPLRRLNNPTLVFVPIVSTINHPVVDSLVDRYVLLSNAAPLKLIGSAGTAPANPAVIPTPILRSHPESWAETDPHQVKKDPEKDQLGPLTVGVAVSDRPRPGGGTTQGTPRLVLISSARMADNPFLENEPTNLDLLMNAVSWLRGRAEQKGIAPKTHVALTLTADPILRNRLVLVPTVMAVLLIIGLGVTTYAARHE